MSAPTQITQPSELAMKLLEEVLEAVATVELRTPRESLPMFAYRIATFLKEQTIKARRALDDETGLPALPAKLERLREALEFYANSDNWTKDEWGCWSIIAPPDYGKGGATARTALAEETKP